MLGAEVAYIVSAETKSFDEGRRFATRVGTDVDGDSDPLIRLGASADACCIDSLQCLERGIRVLRDIEIIVKSGRVKKRRQSNEGGRFLYRGRSKSSLAQMPDTCQR